MKFSQSKQTKEHMTLDEKDKKLLSELGTNARIPLSELARKVGLSREAINNRMQNYLKTGVIQGFRTVIDLKRFGYENYHILIKTKNMPEIEEQSAVSALAKNKTVRSIMKFSGTYDFEIAMVAKSVVEFETLFDDLLSAFGDFVIDYDIMAVTGGFKLGPFPKGFIAESISQAIPKQEASYDVDETDKAILRFIANNAREKLITIAKHVGISADAVNYRLKKMQHSGIIQKYIPAINYDALGYNIYVIPMMTAHLSAQEKSKLRAFFESDLNILWAVRCIGHYNLLFYIGSRSANEMHETIMRMREFFPEKIKDYETLIAYEQYKFTYLPEKLL